MDVTRYIYTYMYGYEYIRQTQLECLSGIYMLRLVYRRSKRSGLLSAELQVKRSVGKRVVVAHELFVGGKLVVLQARQALGTCR